MESDLERSLLAQIDLAEGVYVATASSGAGNTEVVVRLYVASEDGLADAVDEAFESTWLGGPKRLSGIDVGAVVGDKPADADRAAPNELDLRSVAKKLGIGTQNVHLSIHLSSGELAKRYGEWIEPIND